eukprot:2696721-Pleurochrysis_carterae.AAC.2
MPEAIDAKAAAGGTSIFRVGQWVRERAFGFYYCVNAIYKPLFGAPLRPACMPCAHLDWYCARAASSETNCMTLTRAV